MGDARVTFDLRRGVILVEGAADDLAQLFEAARVAAPALKHISVVTTDAAAATARSIEPSSTATAIHRPPALRDFARRFAYENVAQRIAVLAYYAAKYEQRPSFSVKEMSDWFGLCGFKKPTQMAFALTDARRKYGYVESKGRDQWTLTTSGENRVLEFVEQDESPG